MPHNPTTKPNLEKWPKKKLFLLSSPSLSFVSKTDATTVKKKEKEKERGEKRKNQSQRHLFPLFFTQKKSHEKVFFLRFFWKVKVAPSFKEVPFPSFFSGFLTPSVRLLFLRGKPNVLKEEEKAASFASIHSVWDCGQPKYLQHLYFFRNEIKLLLLDNGPRNPSSCPTDDESRNNTQVHSYDIVWGSLSSLSPFHRKGKKIEIRCYLVSSRPPRLARAVGMTG